MVDKAHPKKGENTSNSDPQTTISMARAYTILAAFFWGTSFVVIEFGLEIINPYWFAQFRFLVASMGALAVVLIFKKSIGRELLFGHWVWILGFFNALGFIGQFVGQTMTSATKTALLINVNLITVAIISTIILNERFSAKKGVAVVLSFTGVFLLTTNGDLSQLTHGEFIGDMFALAGGFAWAFYIVTNKKVIHKPKIDIIPLTACVMLATAVIMVPFTLLLGGLNPKVMDIGITGVGYVLYLGIFCNVIPYLLWTKGLRSLSATSSTIILLIEILVAASLALVLLQEFLTIIGIIGGVIIVLAIIIISLDSKKNKQKE